MSWLKYGIRARSKFSQLIHSGATSCAALTMPRWKEACRRLPARPSMRKSPWSIVCPPVDVLGPDPPPTDIPLPQQCSPRVEEAHPLQCYSPKLVEVGGFSEVRLQHPA